MAEARIGQGAAAPRITYPIKTSDLPALAPMRADAKAKREIWQEINSKESRQLKVYGGTGIAVGATVGAVATGLLAKTAFDRAMGAMIGVTLLGAVGGIVGITALAFRTDEKASTIALDRMLTAEDSLDVAEGMHKFGAKRLNAAIDKPFKIFDHNHDGSIDIHRGQPLATDERMASTSGGPARGREDRVYYDAFYSMNTFDRSSNKDYKVTKDEVAPDVFKSARWAPHWYGDYDGPEGAFAAAIDFMRLDVAYAHERAQEG